MCQREGEKEEGNGLGGWLAGPQAASVAGLVWLPEAFSILFDFSSFSFQFFPLNLFYLYFDLNSNWKQDFQKHSMFSWNLKGGFFLTIKDKF
jgi:hypothetical protein